MCRNVEMSNCCICVLGNLTTLIFTFPALLLHVLLYLIIVYTKLWSCLFSYLTAYIHCLGEFCCTIKYLTDVQIHFEHHYKQRYNIIQNYINTQINWYLLVAVSLFVSSVMSIFHFLCFYFIWCCYFY